MPQEKTLGIHCFQGHKTNNKGKREETKVEIKEKFLQPSVGKAAGGTEPRCEPAGAFEGGGR